MGWQLAGAGAHQPSSLGEQLRPELPWLALSFVGTIYSVPGQWDRAHRESVAPLLSSVGPACGWFGFKSLWTRSLSAPKNRLQAQHLDLSVLFSQNSRGDSWSTLDSGCSVISQHSGPPWQQLYCSSVALAGTFIFRSAMWWTSITAGPTVTLWLQNNPSVRAGLLRRRMGLATFHSQALECSFVQSRHGRGRRTHVRLVLKLKEKMVDAIDLFTFVKAQLLCLISVD